jgi:hypothetical protein
MFALNRDPVDHWVTIAPLMHHHIFAVDHWRFLSFVGFNRNHDIHGNSRGVLGSCTGNGDC